MTAARRPHKRAVTYRLPLQMLERLDRLATDRQTTVTSALEALLDDGLTRAGYPPPVGTQRGAE
jgi:hypothetical protein